MVPTRVNNGKRFSSINNTDFTDEALTDRFIIVFIFAVILYIFLNISI
jgi:hypothetical protein